MIRCAILLFLFFGHQAEAKQVILDKKIFKDWKVVITDDDWGGKESVIIKGPNRVFINIRKKYNMVFVSFGLDKIDNSWPKCGLGGFSYRVDDLKPVHTSMGGKNGRGGCGTIRLTKNMVSQMKSGEVMLVRGGGGKQENQFSLLGFEDAWNFAQSKLDKPIKVWKW